MLTVSTELPWDAVPEQDPREELTSSPLGQTKEESSQKEEASPGDPAMASRWTGLVDRIRAQDSTGMEELYRLFSKGIRFYLCRQLGQQELEDKVHDTFLIVVQAIRRGDLRDPERLMGFVRTVVRRQVAAHIDQAVQHRKEQAEMETGTRVADERRTPEEQVILEQKVAIMKEVLSGVSRRDREILTRFYLYEQPQEQICSEMNLSETQFRLLKSRAKARFGELGKRKLSRRPLSKISMRSSAGR